MIAPTKAIPRPANNSTWHWGTRALGLLGTISVCAALGWGAIKSLNWLVLSAVPLWAPAASCDNDHGACWPFLAAKFRLIVFGRYPYDAQWRAALMLALAVGLMWWTASRCLRSGRPSAATFGLVWLIGLAGCWLLMAGGVAGLAPVAPDRWDGLPLTVILACGGCIGAFALALLIVLGRVSDMPVFRTVCTGYIEFVRGVPLVAFMFMVFVLLPLALPRQWSLSPPIQALLVLVIFLSAYMAEVLRGAVESIPLGQHAAAAALGIGYWRTMAWVILPQAIRIATPALVNIFISGIKDTSVVFTVGLLDLLGTAHTAVNDPIWGGRYIEVYLFVGVLYILMCGSVSWFSRRIETASPVR